MVNRALITFLFYLHLTPLQTTYAEKMNDGGNLYWVFDVWNLNRVHARAEEI